MTLLSTISNESINENLKKRYAGSFWRARLITDSQLSRQVREC